MIIGFDAKRLYNNDTGLGNHSRTTIDILTDYFPENAYFLYTPKVKKDQGQRTTDNGLKGYLEKEHCKTFLPRGLVKGGLWRTFCLAKDAEKDGVDLFHGLSNELPMGLRVPSVVTIHDVAFRTFPDMYHWIDRKIYDAKWRYACSHADRIIAISECTKRDIIKYYGVDEAKIDVVYQPVSKRYYGPLTPKGDGLPDCIQTDNVMPSASTPPLGDGGPSFMLYVGSINSRKNLLGVVKSIELLPKDLQIPLVVVGGGREYKEEVQQYIASHKLTDLVIFPSKRIDDDTLQALYRKAEVFVYPSFYEGFGLPVVEALLSGCPVVTSNVSSLLEAGGPYSLQANPYDAKDIAEKIQKVLTDDTLSEKMASEGRKWAMNTFHPEVLAHNLMDVYDRTIKRKI